MIVPLLVAIGAILGVFVVLFVAVALLPKSIFYQHGRPTRLGMLANRFAGNLAALGFPPAWQVRLYVRGRKSGKMTATVLVVGRYEGEDYLVSMLGEKAEWVRNARAAGGEATIRHGRSRKVRLVEVEPARRAPILRAYLQRAYGARPHFPIGPDEPVDAFEPLRDRYPVFRIVPAV